MNLYIGNLSYDATEEGVRTLFEQCGSVAKVTIIKDKITQRARGFGFVEMEDDEAGQTAIRELNGVDFLNRELKVNEAQPRDDSSNRSQGGFRNQNSGGSRGGSSGGQRRGRGSSDYDGYSKEW